MIHIVLKITYLFSFIFLSYGDSQEYSWLQTLPRIKPFSSTAISPDNNFIAIAGFNVYIYKNINNQQFQQHQYIKLDSKTYSLQFSPNGQYLILGATQLIIYKLQQGKFIHYKRLKKYENGCKIVVSMDLIASSGIHYEDEVTIWKFIGTEYIQMYNIDTRLYIEKPIVHGSITSLAFYNAKYLAIGVFNNILIMQLQEYNYTIYQTFTQFNKSTIDSLKFSQDGNSLIVAYTDQKQDYYNQSKIALFSYVSGEIKFKISQILSLNFIPTNIQMCNNGKLVAGGYCFQGKLCNNVIMYNLQENGFILHTNISNNSQTIYQLNGIHSLATTIDNPSFIIAGLWNGDTKIFRCNYCIRQQPYIAYFGILAGILFILTIICLSIKIKKRKTSEIGSDTNLKVNQLGVINHKNQTQKAEDQIMVFEDLMQQKSIQRVFMKKN